LAPVKWVEREPPGNGLLGPLGDRVPDTRRQLFPDPPDRRDRFAVTQRHDQRLEALVGHELGEPAGRALPPVLAHADVDRRRMASGFRPAFLAASSIAL
jgi:hypothetical protein